LSGDFEIEILFVKDRETIDKSFYSISSTQNILERETKTFYASTTTTNPDLINNIINCFYKTLKIPQKEVCQ